jgi:hypothetical protein
MRGAIAFAGRKPTGFSPRALARRLSKSRSLGSPQSAKRKQDDQQFHTSPDNPAFPGGRSRDHRGIALASIASVGECPADKRGVNVKKPSLMTPTGVIATVLAATDLSKENLALAEHQFRLRRLVVQPNGIVPGHSHGERPAIIYIISGDIYEHASRRR